ncbi:hypothetical protein XENTR_v10005430 [Xenopus tropicalis]|nr:hypothetical protein XENTR_v10005430 [Xenopus tropicalis]
MPKKGNRKRLRFKGDDVSSHRVTVADCANSDPAVVKSGRIRKSVANAIQKEENNAVAETGANYPIDIWLLLASYIRPEDVMNFALICKNAWIVTCTAAFWIRLYKRYYKMNVYLPVRLLPECMYKLHCLRACVIRSLYHMYEPFCSLVAKSPPIPELTPDTLANSKVSNKNFSSSPVFYNTYSYISDRF